MSKYVELNMVVEAVRKCETDIRIFFVTKQLSTIARCDYEQTCSLVMSLFDQAASSYQECLQQQSQRGDGNFLAYEGDYRISDDERKFLNNT